MTEPTRQKATGAYFTPPDAVRALVRWAVRSPKDRLLDPSCGDGRFLALHRRSVGVEQEPQSSAEAHLRAPWALIHEGDFFTWAGTTKERFECAAGNPPFIRYQRFTGETRRAALDLCGRLGATFSALTSSWAPFLVATASLLKPGGRMAFVVPAEVGHAPYAQPLLDYLAAHFGRVHLTAVRKKLFTDLSEDVWLLYAEDFGGRTDVFELARLEEFSFVESPPTANVRVSLGDWRGWNGRLRPFLVPRTVLDLYQHILAGRCFRLGTVAKIGIGYVTGANDFFHLRPSEAREREIPMSLLRPAVRNGRALIGPAVTKETVTHWLKQDAAVLLLRLTRNQDVPDAVRRYLRTRKGVEAMKTYKCRNREPWYVVPDVTVPDAFLSYMSGGWPALVANHASCVGTNSVHTVKLNGTVTLDTLQHAWRKRFTELSCEIEGHPLGGGMLKIEPGEAARIALTTRKRWTRADQQLINDGISTLRAWRHTLASR